MFPQKFIERLRTQDYIDPGSLLRSLDQPSPVSVMINGSKWDKIPENSDPVPWCRTGYYLDSRPSFTLDPLFHSGCYYPREASGMFLEQIFGQIIPGMGKMRVLDLCGAPGGKSIHISGLLGSDDSLLISNEVIRQRASVLAETISKWGCENTIVTQNDPSAFGRLQGYFDVIVVDAPCSGEGMFRNRIAVEQWSPENTLLCSERQKRILSDIWPALSDGGYLIYSTCTFNPGENEEIILWLVENHEAEIIPVDISDFSGITEINFHGIRGYGFYPGRIEGEGFFISVVRKSGDRQKYRIPPQKYSGYSRDKETDDVSKRWTEFRKEQIIRVNNDVLALPCGTDEYMHILRNLHVLRGGVAVSHIKGKDHMPVHELVLTKSFRTDAFPAFEADYDTAIRFLRRDTIPGQGLQNGWNVISYMGVNSGLLKNVGSRVNNYYPVEWRIRMQPSSGDEVKIISWKER